MLDWVPIVAGSLYLAEVLRRVVPAAWRRIRNRPAKPSRERFLSPGRVVVFVGLIPALWLSFASSTPEKIVLSGALGGAVIAAEILSYRSGRKAAVITPPDIAQGQLLEEIRELLREQVELTKQQIHQRTHGSPEEIERAVRGLEAEGEVDVAGDKVTRREIVYDEDGRVAGEETVHSSGKRDGKAFPETVAAKADVPQSTARGGEAPDSPGWIDSVIPPITEARAQHRQSGSHIQLRLRYLDEPHVLEWVVCQVTDPIGIKTVWKEGDFQRAIRGVNPVQPPRSIVFTYPFDPLDLPLADGLYELAWYHRTYGDVAEGQKLLAEDRFLIFGGVFVVLAERTRHLANEIKDFVRARRVDRPQLSPLGQFAGGASLTVNPILSKYDNETRIQFEERFFRPLRRIKEDLRSMMPVELDEVDRLGESLPQTVADMLRVAHDLEGIAVVLESDRGASP